MKRARLPYILIPLAALLAVLPLVLQGCSCGHDFDFHLVSWLEAARQFSHGNLHPTWTYTPAWNAGEPRFVFYPPLSWTLGGVLGLVLPWAWTPIAYTWLALTGAGLSLYRLARDFTTPNAALLAAIVYLANPYTLFTAYERTAYAELLAAAILPLLLHAILKPKITIPSIAIPIALLWLTNAPAAVIGCYTLALLTLIRIATIPVTNLRVPHSSQSHRDGWGERCQLAIKSTAGTALGLGLAAFYILPAAYERRYVQIALATVPGMAIRDNFLFHHTGLTPDDLAHDQVLHTASIIAVILLALTAITLLLIRATKPGAPYLDSEMWVSRESATAPAHSKNATILITILTIVITFLLTPISAPIWNHAPELLFLQFPWRFLAVQAPLLALALALALRKFNLQSAITAILGLVIASALIYPSYKLFAQACDDPDTVQAHTALFHSTNPGVEPTDEYTPNTADNDALTQNNPPYWFANDPAAPAPANIQPGPAPHALTVNAPQAESLILNLRDYPAWQITVNGIVTGSRQPRPDGLIAIPIPNGASTIVITHKTLPDQIIGFVISLISLVTLILCISPPSFIIKS